MKTLYRRIVALPRRESGEFMGDPIPHDPWQCFRLIRAIEGQRSVNGFTMFELESMIGARFKASSRIIAPYPSIVTLTREVGSFDVCTTFDVRFSGYWELGSVPVRHHSGEELLVPSHSVAEAMMHLHDLSKAPLAV